jgi:hypothetical protein
MFYFVILVYVFVYNSVNMVTCLLKVVSAETSPRVYKNQSDV